ncbi:MAG TPA: peptide ABC transporter substrate-binding protein [Lachnospiraceae bacterium]|nr:peptide ABC transporter substrate-binding protein [Lachnospiraceae bacterium]
MKKRSKVLAALLSFVTAASLLSACGGSTATTSTATASTAASTATASAASTVSKATGSTASTAATTTSSGKTLTVELGPDPETVDPALNSSVDGGNYITFCFDNLLSIDKDNKVIGACAEKWETSTDGLTWTFHLRDGLKWSDGSDLTANDFVYSWQRVANPDTAAPYGETVLGMLAGYKDAIGNPDADGNTTTTPDPTKLGVKATDDKTLVVTLSAPCAYFDKLAAFATLMPVKQDVVDKDPDGWSVNPKEYITNGAFTISEWVPGSYILFKKNPNYWNASAIKLDTIKCLLMEDQNAAYSAYQSGEALMIKDVPTNEIDTLKTQSDFHIDPDLGTYYISLNDQKDMFKDPKVRQALSLALDRKYISETITKGTYTAAGNFVGTGVSDWDGSAFMDNANGGKPYIDTDDFQGNLAKAKQLMSDAGYPDGQGFPTITYSTNDAGYHKAIAEYLQQAWKELGITVNVDVVEWKSFTPQRRAGDYEVARNGWLLDYNDASNILDLMYSTNGNNDSKYNSTDYDALMDKARSEADAKTRSGYLHQAEDEMMTNAACIPLLYYNDFYLQSAKVTGSWHSPYGFWMFQYADVTE